MDELERRLRAAFDDDRLELTPAPDSLRMIRSGVRRRRRNRVLATALTVAVLGAGGAVAATALPGSSGRSVPPVQPPVTQTPTTPPTPKPKPSMPPPTIDEVPWLADPYDYHYPPSFPGAVADPSVPWCRAAQLTLTSSWQGATGSWVGPLTVTNTSASTCAVQGQPAVRMVAADGHSLVSSVPEPFYVDAWVRLAPHAAASSMADWSPEFCHEPAPARVEVDLPHGGGSLSTSMHGSPRCDAQTLPTSAGLLSADGFVPQGSTEPFTPLAGLNARLDHVPTTVAAGAVVHYRLALWADRPGVALRPCLPFRERLVAPATGHVAAEQDFRLNCDAAPPTIGTFESNRTTYFDLELQLPGDIPLGAYQLVWQSVLKPVGATSDGDVRVVAPPPPCADGSLAATAGRGGAAAGNYALEIVLHNVSSATCSVRGYPGVELLDGSGHAMTPAPTRGSGYIVQDRGPQTVVLDPGATAWFQIGGPDYDNSRQQQCPAATSIGVYAPDTRQRLVVHARFSVCSGITFSAVAPGRLNG